MKRTQNRIIDQIHKALKTELNINIRRRVVAHIWRKHGCLMNAQKCQTGLLIPSHFFNQHCLIRAIIQSTKFLNDGWDELFPERIHIFASLSEPVGYPSVNLTKPTNIPCSTKVALVIVDRNKGLLTAYPI
ncbi:hypothetical protein T4A_1956 [Trichinella pseudospiralis]|uniref:Uncharacterized protein n=1 Tax=Trichinella pseudospiralis TaxID=6337 RepID=A0A0V1DXV7_TRIPS|nr:hypothetical protein T4A_1956 [Trichinella pseudospiralis]